MMSLSIQSTAGAVPVPTDKAGQFTMQKVKVHRYVAGKRPEYAADSDDDEEEVAEGGQAFVRSGQGLARGGIVMAGGAGGLRRAGAGLMGQGGAGGTGAAPDDAVKVEEDEDGEVEEKGEEMSAEEVSDPRLRRLMAARVKEEVSSDEEDDRVTRHKRLREPELFGADAGLGLGQEGADAASSDEEEELDEEEMERRREELRRKVLQNRANQEIEMEQLKGDAAMEEEEDDDEDELDLSEEEYTDSEDEFAPRLKPVFVRKRDRVTLLDKTATKVEEEEEDPELQRMERRRQTIKMLEDESRREAEEARAQMDALNQVCSDDEGDDEADYESWKLRELKRIRREREQRENAQREKETVERVHGMTEEERREEFRKNPRLVTNKMPKGKYKFLQKYYHRGAFFMDGEEDVYKRDVAQPTLEDHFDKTVLPKVMQVKNFGRAGRTKYTHLVDQDTSQTDSPWYADTQQNLKFHLSRGGGMKQSFAKPGVKKK